MRRRIPPPGDYQPIDVPRQPIRRPPSAFYSGEYPVSYISAPPRKMPNLVSTGPVSPPVLSQPRTTQYEYEGPDEPPVVHVARTQRAIIDVPSRSSSPEPSMSPAGPPRIVRFQRRQPIYRSEPPSRSWAPPVPRIPFVDDSASIYGSYALAVGDEIRFLKYELDAGHGAYANSKFEMWKRRPSGRVRGFIHRNGERTMKLVKIPWNSTLEKFLSNNYELSQATYADYYNYIMPTYRRWR